MYDVQIRYTSIFSFIAKEMHLYNGYEQATKFSAPGRKAFRVYTEWASFKFNENLLPACLKAM